MKIKDRIKELRRVPASALIPNPKNWRTHPAKQKAALSAMLEEVGIVGALLAYETPGGLMLIDGHLRAEEVAGTDVPVIVLDVTEAEADLLMLAYDPLSAMANIDGEALRALAEEVAFDSGELEKFTKDFLEGIPLEKLAPDEFPEVDENIETSYHCDACGYKWSGGA
jgi:hypothetical protein